MGWINFSLSSLREVLCRLTWHQKVTKLRRINFVELTRIKTEECEWVASVLCVLRLNWSCCYYLINVKAFLKFYFNHISWTNFKSKKYYTCVISHYKYFETFDVGLKRWSIGQVNYQLVEIINDQMEIKTGQKTDRIFWSYSE